MDSFAYEWESFDCDYGRKSWIRDIVKPVLGSVGYFKNKTVIDCGAGSGRQSLWMAEAGAKFVFSIELSNSAMTMVREVTKKCKDRARLNILMPRSDLLPDGPKYQVKIYPKF